MKKERKHGVKLSPIKSIHSMTRPSSTSIWTFSMLKPTWTLFLGYLVFAYIVEESNSFQNFIHVHNFQSRNINIINEYKIPYIRKPPFQTKLFVSELEKIEKDEKTSDSSTQSNQSNHNSRASFNGNTIRLETLDSSTYEAALLETWEKNEALQTGFDWEIEKLRRNFAGLQQLSDGTWVKKPSLMSFLVSKDKTTRKRPISMQIEPPKPVNPIDVAKLITINLLTSVGFGPALGMAAVPDAVIQKYEGSFFSFIKGALGGDLQTLAGGPLFLLLAKYYKDYGPIFNLSFGPKSFLVISDPVMAKHILRESRPDQYCKGMLAEILEPIMGKGLIPADPETWKVRRRALVPGFHKRWLNKMVDVFADCAENLVDDISTQTENSPLGAKVFEMEERFCSVTLDIIGRAVFNYDFGSVTKESPIVKAVYRTLRETEHRSSSFIPYWNLPYADKWMGGQVEFRRDIGMLDNILTDLINRAIESRREASIEDLENRDYNLEENGDPSLLRFLVDMRDEDLNSKQLRDDLMTMLIAGHETTAAMLTWTLYELTNADPGMLNSIQVEIRNVMGTKKRPDYDDIVNMPRLRMALIEALRLYPEPPVLIRRARIEDTLPPGGTGLDNGVKILRGTDIFVSTWNLHRSPELWEDAEKFDPTRWERNFRNDGIKGWQGFNPDLTQGLYPNEIATDFAFLPFGGGQRKCVGDQFAMLEATVTMVSTFDSIFILYPYISISSLF